jgi:hypothetical protein
MEEADFRAMTLINFLMLPTLMRFMKRSGTLIPRDETEIYETVLTQLEHQQAIAGADADVVQRARVLLEAVVRS